MPKNQQSFLEQYGNVLPPVALGYRIKLLTQEIQRRFQETLDPYGLTPLQWAVLCRLWVEDGLATSRLGQELSQLGGTITVVLPGLERGKYVRRRRDKSDRRIMRVWLTESGETLKWILPRQVQQLQTRLFGGLGPRQGAAFDKSIDALLAALAHDHEG